MKAVRTVLCPTKHPLTVYSTLAIPPFQDEFMTLLTEPLQFWPCLCHASYALVAFRDKKRARTGLGLTSQPSHTEKTGRKLAERIERYHVN